MIGELRSAGLATTRRLREPTKLTLVSETVTLVI
jgi:hypothetical protein